MKNNRLFALVGNMLKIGVIGFGGGTALIPVLETQIVERSGIVTEEHFNRDVMIASITPGALPVEIAAGIGREVAGDAGMIASAASMALPGAFFTLFLLVLFSGIGDTLKDLINFAAVLVSGLIIVLLARYVLGTLKQGAGQREKWLYAFVILAVFGLSAEKNLYQLLGISRTPVFALSSVQVLAAAFFVILFTEGQLRRIGRTAPALILTLAYFLCAGKAHILPHRFAPALMLLMAALALLGLFQSVREAKGHADTAKRSRQQKGGFPGKELLRSVLLWFLFVLILSLPAIFLTVKTVPFLGTGFLSSVMSFGGGDAYLSVAEGLFVDGGVVSHADFFGNIVTVANALPGSILCKVLTGIGYYLGYGLHSSVIEGILMALCGFSCSVAASGSIYIVVWAVHQKFERLKIFRTIRHFIRPIVSGLLVNVALSLFLSVIRPFFLQII